MFPDLRVSNLMPGLQYIKGEEYSYEADKVCKKYYLPV